MATVRVYQYDYLDGLLKRERRSVDFATADAIVAIKGATILAESMREVDESLLDENGVVRAADLPPRGETRPPGHSTRPGEPRVGPG